MSESGWIGKTLGGRYRIEELVGQGGMSAVYRAEDPNLRRTVAVKVIHPHLSGDPQFVSRFEEEAALVAQLRHPNIIQVFDFDNENGIYYMVLDFVPGETLQERLTRLNAGGMRLPIGEAVQITTSICNALAYAHRRGLVHRDVKPSNIMLDVHGQAILMDFGVAKIAGGKRHTATGAVVGTAIYMSPEQIRGEQIDSRVDIYALGVTLFEMLSGRPPFEADSAMTTLMMHINDPVPDLRELNPDVPPGIVAVVGKALEKDRDRRFAGAQDFADALRAVDLESQPGPGAAPPKSAVSTSPADTGPEATSVETPEPASAAGGETAIEAPVGEIPSEVAPAGKTAVETPPPEPTSAGATAVETPAGPEPPGGPPQGPAGPGKGSRPAASQEGPPSGSVGSVLDRLPVPRMALFGGGAVILLLIAIFAGSRLFGGGIAAPEATPTPAPTEIPTIAPSVTPVPPTAVPSETPTPTVIPTATVPTEPYVRINGISIEGDHYVVEYETFGYTETLPGMHVHFYYDTVSEQNAGVPGAGPWILYGGPRPFEEYSLASRPAGANQMCARVAHEDHSIIPSSGNCVDLPSDSDQG
jgi:serine/threonine protein kinase